MKNQWRGISSAFLLGLALVVTEAMAYRKEGNKRWSESLEVFGDLKLLMHLFIVGLMVFVWQGSFLLSVEEMVTSHAVVISGYSGILLVGA